VRVALTLAARCAPAHPRSGLAVESRGLLETSELEQDIACQGDHVSILERVFKVLNDPRPTDDDKIRLVMLFALRFEDKQNDIAHLKGVLRERLLTEESKIRARAVDAVLQHAGAAQRSGELWGEKGNAVSRIFKSVTAGFKGVDNIYTQHKPLLHTILVRSGCVRSEQFWLTVRGCLLAVSSGEEQPQDVLLPLRRQRCRLQVRLARAFCALFHQRHFGAHACCARCADKTTSTSTSWAASRTRRPSRSRSSTPRECRHRRRRTPRPSTAQNVSR
jgi:hypothetical protein